MEKKMRGHSGETREPLRVVGHPRGIFNRIVLAFASALHDTSSSYTARVPCEARGGRSALKLNFAGFMGAMQLTKRLRKDLSDVWALAELSRKRKSRKLGQVQTGILVPPT